ncbi:DUF551 domain-containing protein, partial [Salmonella enterica]
NVTHWMPIPKPPTT